MVVEEVTVDLLEATVHLRGVTVHLEALIVAQDLRLRVHRLTVAPDPQAVAQEVPR